MEHGNTNAALKLPTNNMKDWIIPLNNETLTSLTGKHPDSKNVNGTVLMTGVPGHFTNRECT